MLSRSPLVLVLTQARFMMDLTNLSPNKYEEIDGIMGLIGYPMAQTSSESSSSLQVYKREYVKQDLSYRVMIAGSFISLYCVVSGDGISYRGHESFIEEFRTVLDALSPLIDGARVGRLGYRYVDLLTIDDASRVLRPAARGLAATVDDRYAACSSLIDARLSFDAGCNVDTSESIPENGVHVATGTIAPGAIIDPSIPPTKATQWVIDVDAYLSQPSLSSASDVLCDQADFLSSSARDVFYSMVVNDQFEELFA